MIHLIYSILILIVFLIYKNNKNHRKISKKLSPVKVVSVKVVSVKDGLKTYIEEFILDCGLSLDNIYVYSGSNDSTSNGFCSISLIDHYYKEPGLRHVYVKKGECILKIPEVIDYATARTCIHEIAHYLYNHNLSDISIVTKEFEADEYAYKMLDKFEIYMQQFQINDQDFMKEYYSNIHKIEMKIIKILCSYNILQYTNKLTINAIPTNIVSFLNQNVYYETINK